jgi:hypothetical protein
MRNANSTDVVQPMSIASHVRRYGDGDGSGYGYGYGDGYGYGYGYGDGSGYGYGLKTFCGLHVYIVDGVQTIITHVHGNVARGLLLSGDLTTTPCYIVKQEDTFAHGKTLRGAYAALAEKLFEEMPLEERIDAFIKAHNVDDGYTAQSFSDWHGRLNGSCPMGREQWMRDRQIDINSDMTVSEFIKLTENAYGSDVIREVKKRYG